MINSSSLLPELQAILSVCFALNLAYLGLPRFRYRQTIADYAHEQLNFLEELSGKVGKRIDNTSWYVVIVRLSLLPEQKADEVSKLKWGIPNEIWGICYRVFLERKLDMLFCTFLCMMAAVLIALGCAHSVGSCLSTQWLFEATWIDFWLIISVLGTTFPPFLVVIGRFVVRGAKAYIDRNVSDMTHTLQSEVAQLPDPEID